MYRKSQNVKRLKEIGESLDLFTHFMMIQRGGINEITIYYFRKLTSVKSQFAKIHLNEIDVFEIPPRWNQRLRIPPRWNQSLRNSTSVKSSLRNSTSMKSKFAKVDLNEITVFENSPRWNQSLRNSTSMNSQLGAGFDPAVAPRGRVHDVPRALIKLYNRAVAGIPIRN